MKKGWTPEIVLPFIIFTLIWGGTWIIIATSSVQCRRNGRSLTGS